MTVKAEDWLDDIMPHVPGATSPYVLQEISAALREFCDDGRAWVHSFHDESTVADDPELILSDMPDNTVLGYVLRVSFGDNPSYRRYLPATATPMLVLSRIADRPLAHYMEDANTIYVIPTPAKDLLGAYEVEASLLPYGDDIEFPIVFRTHWRDAVISGALARLFAQVSKPWTDVRAAAYYGRKFRNHTKRARAITDARFSNAKSLWSFPDFASKTIGNP